MYGPVKIGKNLPEVYFHELCATWCPEIYYNESNKVQNLKEGIKRSKTIKCSFCTEWGGGLGCKYEQCPNSYHYLCAVTVTGPDDSKALFMNDFHLYCPDHRKMASAEDMAN